MTAAPRTPRARAMELGLAVFSAASGLWRILEQRRLGFPDGHLTELERTMQLPHFALAGLAIGLAGAVLFSGRGAWWYVSIVATVLADRVALDAMGRLLGLESGQGG